MCGLIYLDFLAQVFRTLVWQTESAFSFFSFYIYCPVELSLSAVHVFWLFDKPKSPWIVREEWPFVVPTCCHCGFDCLSGQHGLGRNHLHTATPADGHSFWRGSQMLLQVLWGLRQSERVIDYVSERLSSITTKCEGRRTFAQISFPLSGQTAVKKGDWV